MSRGDYFGKVTRATMVDLKKQMDRIGRQFGGDGILRDWWGAVDAARGHRRSRGPGAVSPG